MALQTPYFGKREPVTTANPRSVTPVAPASSGTTVSTHPAATSTAADASSSSNNATTTSQGGSKLTVGPNIKLKGVEITDCDTLVVEGMVEATMDSRVMQISEKGAFKGSAEIDIAEIHGQFDGNLTVRQKLVIYSTGKVSGKIRYGNVVIEEGGRLSGEIEFGAIGQSSKGASNAPYQVAA